MKFEDIEFNLNFYISQRMMTEEPDSYQRKLQSLISRAQQVHYCLFFSSVEDCGFFWMCTVGFYSK